MIAFAIDSRILLAGGIGLIVGILFGAAAIIALAGDKSRQDIERPDRLR